MSHRQVTTVRHMVAPSPNGCRWCGKDLRGHVIAWAGSAGYHSWSEPTPEQRRARMFARRRSR